MKGCSKVMANSALDQRGIRTAAPANRPPRRMGLLGPPMVGGTLLLAAIVAFATTTEGAIAVTDVDGFLEFYVGVFALLALTASVVWGLIANNRFFLRIGHRIFAQAVHRGFSVAAVGLLLVPIFVKGAGGHAVKPHPGRRALGPSRPRA